MPRGLRYSVATILIAFLVAPQADARGGGGGGGGGFHGGFSGFHGGFRGGVRIGRPITRPSFVHNPRVGFPARQPLPLASRSPQQLRPNGGIGVPFNGFATGFPNTVPTQFSTGVPRWGNGWGNWIGPVSGWWPSDWGSGGYYGYAYPPQAQAPPPEPQVIVISQDGQGRMKTAETPADYSYVKGCHAIANGYHCDAATATP